MRAEQRRRLILEHVATIPESPRWRLHPLIENVILPFDLLDPETGKWYRIHFGLTDYNVEPPRLSVRHPVTGAPTHDVQYWPPQLAEQATHPVTGKAFCCVLGLADYHSHPLHADRPWEVHRNTRTLDTIMADLADRLTPGKVPKVTRVARPL